MKEEKGESTAAQLFLLPCSLPIGGGRSLQCKAITLKKGENTGIETFHKKQIANHGGNIFLCYLYNVSNFECHNIKTSMKSIKMIRKRI